MPQQPVRWVFLFQYPMAKRFTDTDLWDKEWFMSLSCRLKCLVKFVRDKADLSGVWSPNWKIAGVYIGEPVSVSDLLGIDDGRQFKLLDNGKIFCIGFIEFQYKTLSLESRVHQRIISQANVSGAYPLIEHLIVGKSETSGAKRSRITETLNLEIFAEDQYTCQYCGEQKKREELVLDHIIPIVKGGSNDKNNLTTACRSCNAKKWEFDVFEFINKHKIKPLDSLSKKINTLQDKEEEKEEVKEEEKEKEEVKEQRQKIELVFPYNSPEFMQLWSVMAEGPKWKKKTKTALQASLKILSRYPERVAIGMMEKCIAGNWQGLVEPNKNELNGTTKTEYGTPERAAEYDRLFTERYGVR